MYSNAKQWRDIRNLVLVERRSKRQVVGETGISWATLGLKQANTE